MQKFIALCALFAVFAVVASDSPTREPIPIVRSESVHNDDGSYNFMYEGGDGSFREESGAIQNAGSEDESIKVTGSYKYIDANGETVNVQYTADENGFVPVGSIIAKEISDAALAARDLPNDEPQPNRKQ